MSYTRKDLQYSALLSNAAYGEQTPPMFERLPNFPGNGADGFQASVFKHKQTGEIFIAYRGTDDRADLLADGEIPGILRHWAPSASIDSQVKQADDMYKQVKALYPDSDIHVTGHSLGGGLAQYVGAKYGAPTQTFEAPGMKGYIEDHLKDHFSDNIYNNYRETDVVPHASGAHIGNDIIYPSVNKTWEVRGPDGSLQTIAPSNFDLLKDALSGDKISLVYDSAKRAAAEHSITFMAADIYKGVEPISGPLPKESSLPDQVSALPLPGSSLPAATHSPDDLKPSNPSLGDPTSLSPNGQTEGWLDSKGGSFLATPDPANLNAGELPGQSTGSSISTLTAESTPATLPSLSGTPGQPVMQNMSYDSTDLVRAPSLLPTPGLPGQTLVSNFPNVTAESTPATLPPLSGATGQPVTQGMSLLGPEFSGLRMEVPAPVVNPDNPLNITDTEGKSIGQRLGLGENQYLGKPNVNADGSWFYPVYNKADGSSAGGIDMARDADGYLTGTYANQKPHFDGDIDWDRPHIETGYSGGKQEEKDLLKHKTEDSRGFDGVEGGFGGKAEGSANFFDGNTGKFVVAPDGSGYAGKIINKFGEVSGEIGGGGMGGFEDGKVGAKGEFGAGVDGKIASGGVEAEKYWSITVRPDGTCKQTSVEAEGDAFIGGAAKYTGSYGTEKWGSKLSLGFGPGMSAGGNINWGKNFECSNPFANPGASSETPAAFPQSTGASVLASANGKSITAIETEAEAMDQATEGHAKRAESAAQRAVAAAHRAAAARAQMQALLSGI